MEILAKAICKGCGKEFEPRNSVGRPRTYCSEQCRRALNNKRYRENKAKELGMSYHAWKLRNDPTFREKKKEYNRKYKENKIKELGMSYHAWEWRNDPTFREKKKGYNRKYKENKIKELGMSYYAWKWRNDPVYREKKREYARKYNRSLKERRHDKEKEEE